MPSKITLLTATPSYLNNILYEMRDVSLQQDRMRFRLNLEKIGEMLAFEISKHLTYSPQEVITPLGSLTMDVIVNQPVVVSILRAGVPLHNGFLRVMDKADNGYISAYRHHTGSNEFIVKVEYLAMPEITNRDLILLDPMIATGRSLVLSYKAIQEAAGRAERVFIGGVIASEEGLEYVQRNIPNAQIFVAAIDKELTAKNAYIVPGLGDAGDLAFGPK